MKKIYATAATTVGTTPKETPTPSAIAEFIAEYTTAAVEKMPWAYAVQPDVSPRARRPRALKEAVVPSGPSHEDLDDAVHELERLVWAYKTGDGVVDTAGLNLLQRLLDHGGAARKYRVQRAKDSDLEVIKGVLMERLPRIYEQFARGDSSPQDYEVAIIEALRFVGIDPTADILDALVVDRRFIVEPLDADDEQRETAIKGAGAVETAAYTVSQALTYAGYKKGVKPRRLHSARAWSPRDRARLTCSEPFGSHVMLPRGASSITTNTPRPVIDAAMNRKTTPPADRAALRYLEGCRERAKRRCDGQPR